MDEFYKEIHAFSFCRELISVVNVYDYVDLEITDNENKKRKVSM